MREAVHIFLKDSRQLRYPILVLLLWMIIFVLATASPPAPPLWGERNQIPFVVGLLTSYVLPLFWWFLISQVFHAEALPGDRQFWVTRPYSRASLFGAKALFVLAYVSVPLTIAQIVIAAGRGFPLAVSLMSIAWAQALILMVVVLPAAALASITSRLTQFVVAGLLAPLLFLAYGLLNPWSGFAWLRTAVAVSAIVAIAGSVLFVQLTRRRTAVSRVMALGGILALVATLPLLSWRTAFAVQSRLARGWDGTLGAELVRPGPRTRPLTVPTAADGVRPIRLAFLIRGLPSATVRQCEASEFTLESPDGTAWSRGIVPGGLETPDGCWFLLSVPNAFIQTVADRPVRVRGLMYLTLFGPERSTAVPLDLSATVVPDLGVCRAAKTYRPTNDGGETAMWTSCSTPFRTPRSLISAELRSVAIQGPSYSPFPADLQFLPFEFGQNLRLANAANVATRTPLAHVRFVVEASDLRLADFDIGN